MNTKYSIGEFSTITGLSVKTLRFYHEKGIPAQLFSNALLCGGILESRRDSVKMAPGKAVRKHQPPPGVKAQSVPITFVRSAASPSEHHNVSPGYPAQLFLDNAHFPSATSSLGMYLTHAAGREARSSQDAYAK